MAAPPVWSLVERKEICTGIANCRLRIANELMNLLGHKDTKVHSTVAASVASGIVPTTRAEGERRDTLPRSQTLPQHAPHVYLSASEMPQRTLFFAVYATGAAGEGLIDLGDLLRVG